MVKIGVKEISIAVAVIMIVASGALAYYSVNRQQTEPQPGETTTPSTSTEATAQKHPNKFTGPITELLEFDSAVQCTFSAGAGSTNSGTAYTANGKVRQDMKIPYEEGMVETHTIIDNSTAYIWSSLDPSRGTKLTIKAEDENDQGTNQKLPNIYNYECAAWKLDYSLFILPSEIEFIEATTSTNNVQGQATIAVEDRNISTDENMERLRETLCISCDKTSNPEDCRKTLGCD